MGKRTKTLTLTELCDQILGEIIPEAMLNDDDRKVILEHRDFLLGLRDQLVTSFFDVVFSHPHTRAIFSEAEQEHPTSFVYDWWTRTVEGPLDDEYLKWMTLVGLVHIRRGVRNPMMISMFAVVKDLVFAAAMETMDFVEADKLRIAFSHYGATVSSLITESYTQTYIYALEDIGGLEAKLVERIMQVDVSKLEERAREELGV